MGLFDGAGAADAFEDLLEREKRLILAGDIDGVHRLSREKNRLMKRLAKSRIDPERLARLRVRADHNNTLLEASARGFRAVQAQLARLSDAGVEHRTYARDGRRRDLGRGANGMNRRA